jgi:uncharacterized membrane protein
MILAASLFGRLHPLLVHLPIGILLLAALFEFLSYFRRYRKLRGAVQTALLWGALSALASVLSGFILAQDGGYDDRLLYVHRNTGIVTAVYSWILFFVRKSVITFFKEKKRRKLVRIFLFIPLIGLISLTGHLGGSITHGEDFLFNFSSDETARNPVLKISSSVNLDSAVMYKDVLEPIFQARCYSCHSASKQKGQLRLDQPTFILKGGKNGSVLSGVVPDSSTLYNRLMLPLEDEHHMPPHAKPQPSSAEIELIHAWLIDGADFDRPIGQFKASAKIKSYILAMVAGNSKDHLIPEREIQPATPEAINTLTSKGVLVIPIGTATNYLSANFVNARSLSDADLALLLPIKDQLLWLNVGRTKITNAGLDVVNKLSGLRQLNLEYTAIQDDGLKRLATLNALETLNVVGTGIGDAGLHSLIGLKSLKKIFLFQTNVTAAGISDFMKSSSHVLLDTGSYQLPPRITDTLEYRE